MKAKIYDAPHNFARVEEHDVCPTLIARAGTGGGNVPLVLGSAQANAAVLDDDTCPTLTAQMGTGGNNMPLVLTQNQIGEIRCSDTTAPTLTGQANASARNAPLVLMDQGGGVMSIEHDKVGTLRAQTHGHEPVVLQEAYRISSDASNGMRSNNPLTGFKETDLSPTLDTVDPSPSKAQGGLAIVSPHMFKLRSGKEGGGKGYLGQDDKTFTLSTGVDQYLMEPYMLAGNMIGRSETSGPQGKGYRQGQAFTLNATDVQGVAFEPMPINTQTVQGRPSDNGRMGSGIGKPGDPANTLQANHSHGVFDMQARVRKLTPTECERLQGFPDGWTKIPYRGKNAEDCPDSPRYKAIGNSWAVPCVRWIGKRIDKELKK